MVTLYRQPGWKIAVYGREHGVPHFHVEGPGFRCSISIASGDLIVGGAPARVVTAARVWSRENTAFLLAMWLELNP